MTKFPPRYFCLLRNKSPLLKTEKGLHFKSLSISQKVYRNNKSIYSNNKSICYVAITRDNLV